MKRFIFFTIITSLVASLASYFSPDPSDTEKTEVSDNKSMSGEKPSPSLSPVKAANANTTKKAGDNRDDKQTLLSALQKSSSPASVYKHSKKSEDSSSDLTVTGSNTTETKSQKQVSETVAKTNQFQPLEKGDVSKTEIVSDEINNAPKSSQTQPVEYQHLSKKTLSSLKQIADEDSHAALELGLRLLRGHGIRQDSYNGLLWLRNSAELGNIDAQKVVGKLYMTGFEEMGPDYREALKWLSLSASQGDKESAALVEDLRQAENGHMSYLNKYSHLNHFYWYYSHPYRLYWQHGHWVYIR